MSETGQVAGPGVALPRLVPRWRCAASASALGALLTLLGGCANGGSQAPNSATSASLLPGAAPGPGEATQGAVSVRIVRIERTGTRLAVTARIHNAGPVADQLRQIGSQVSPTLTLNPPLPVPPGASVDLGTSGSSGSSGPAGTSGSSAVLAQTERLESGGTVALTFQFRAAGALQVFSGFKDTDASRRPS